MNQPAEELIIITTRSDQFSVAPGASLVIPVFMINKGLAPDQVRVQVEGIPLTWVSADQQVLVLQPGELSQINLTIQPPGLPFTIIGRHNLTLRAVSTIDPNRSGQTQIKLTVAGYEVKGRLSVLLDGLKYSAVPGELLAIPVVLINQGLGLDTFRLAINELPEGWYSIPDSEILMKPGESRQAVLNVHPPREPGSRASRHPFQIMVSSQEAPDQSVSIDCVLTVTSFIEYKSELEAAQPDQNLPARVSVQNFSNIPVTFKVTWSSPEEFA